MILWFRKLLIRFGKVLPFVICVVVLINYAETAFALATSHFLLFDGIVIPNTPLSFLVGLYFEYNLQFLLVLVVLSIAISTCVYNKLACAYLGFNLLEKSYFDFELEPTYIYMICIVNIIIATWLVYKGFETSFKQ